MNATGFFLILFVVVAGAATGLQGPTNARLAVAVGSPVNAALVSFAVGTLALALVAAVMHVKPDMMAVRGLPWFAWMGGLYGAMFVVAAAFAVPRIGVANTIILLVAGQVLISLVVDHFGLMGVPRQPLTLPRLGGVLMVVGGVLLARRG